MNHDIAESFTKFLRQASKVRCDLGGCGQELPDTENQIKAHLSERHPDLVEEKGLDELVREFKKYAHGAAKLSQHAGNAAGHHELTNVDVGSKTTPGDVPAEQRSPKKRKESPVAEDRGVATTSSPPRRSRARPPENDPDFHRAPQTGKLWNPDTPSAPSSRNTARGRRPDHVPPGRRARVEDRDGAPDADSTGLFLKPETRAISQEQLVAEVKGIYSGLVMVEAKCIDVDNAQSSQTDPKLNNDQWQALIALHRTLLHEHHDFFLASQHPSASPALKRLAAKYAMPARMWRHGIHSFLELLRHRLPASREHMLTFIYLAYSMMALLYETVPTFEDTWIECLGDIGRYRMSIEDDDIRDRETWTSVSRSWYSKASDKSPTTGRLYHHLAILARPNALQQLFFYAKCLCVPIPFAPARESIMTLFDPIMNAANPHHHSRLMQIDADYVKLHGMLFSGRAMEEFSAVEQSVISNLNHHIGRTTRRWVESGYYMAIANCCAICSYGREDGLVYKAIRPQHTDETTDASSEAGESTDKQLECALHLAHGTCEVVFRRFADPNILPFAHVVLVFLHYITFVPPAMAYVDKTFPWKLLAMLLNSLLLSYRDYEKVQRDSFPRSEKELPRPLPEDYAMRALLWADKYFPADWFSNDKIDDDEKTFEVPSMTDERKERILWLGVSIARHEKWLLYDKNLHQFSVTEPYEQSIASSALDSDMGNDGNNPELEFTSRLSNLGSATSEGANPQGHEQEDTDMLDIDQAGTSTKEKPIIQQH